MSTRSEYDDARKHCNGLTHNAIALAAQLHAKLCPFASIINRVSWLAVQRKHSQENAKNSATVKI